MPCTNFLKNKIRKLFTGTDNIILKNKIPSHKDLEKKLDIIKEIGLYLHIPFCKQICPYCPYNKEIYSSDAAKLYIKAVKKEIDFYRNIFEGKPVTSFYIGGGTPTTILYDGLYELLEYIYKYFNTKREAGLFISRAENHLFGKTGLMAWKILLNKLIKSVF